jgi:hypothetical protein
LSPALPGEIAKSLRACFTAVLALVCLFVSTVEPAWAQSLDRLEIVTASGVHSFSVEVVSDDASREKGLMYRRFMPEDRGMLFDFGQQAPVAFWMKNTYIPLDMIFISRQGVVKNVVANAEPFSERLIPSAGPVYGVLEVNGGVAARIGLKVGDKVKHKIFAP